MSDELETPAASANAGTGDEEGNTASNDEPSTEEGNSQGAANGAQDDWIVPGRFRTVQDLVQSYQNLESLHGRVSNEYHNLRRNLGTAPRDSKQEIADFAKAVEQNPVEAVRNVIRPELEGALTEAKKVKFETEYSKLMGNKEFAELEPLMTQIAEANRHLITNNDMQYDPAILPILFYAARGVRQEQIAKEAEARGKKQGEAAALKKNRVSVEGSSGNQGKSSKNAWELSREDLRKEIEKGNLG